MMIRLLPIFLLLSFHAKAQRLPAASYTQSLGVAYYPACDCVGSIDNGDWVSYTLVAGLHRLFMRVASPSGGRVLINGQSVAIPMTGAWDKWITISDTFRTTGTLKILSIGNPWNLAYIDIREWWDVNGDSSYILTPVLTDTIACTGVIYISGSLVAYKAVKFLRRTAAGITDDKGIKLDVLYYITKEGYKIQVL